MTKKADLAELEELATLVLWHVKTAPKGTREGLLPYILTDGFMTVSELVRYWQKDKLTNFVSYNYAKRLRDES